MGLKEQVYLTSYNKAEHDIADMFYLPCMRHSSRYDRISGYFEVRFISLLGMPYGSLSRMAVRYA